VIGTTHDEIDLIQRAKEGDKEAAGELYRRHADDVLRYIQYRVKDPVIAEDLAAEVFLKALEGLPGYQHTGAPFLAWLYRIARARTADYWRKLQRRQESPLMDTLPSRTPSPEELVSTWARLNATLTTLVRLTPDQRQVIILRFFEDMSLAEVAATLDKSVGAVKALQFRALGAMARLLEDGQRPLAADAG
jgi:RNA polymerase sigma-70 factor (ECF subfamily)